LALGAAFAGFVAGCGGGSKATAATAPSTGTGTTNGGSGSMVAPQGAAYSYRVPSGFKLVKGTAPGRHVSTVVPAYIPADSGTISAFEITPSDSLEGSKAINRFLASFDRQSVAFYRSRGGTTTPGARTTVAGHPALCWKISHFNNPASGTVLDGDGCAIVAGRVVVQQGCNWKPSARTVVEAGCKAMRASLKIS
jgi:hypothetical protein